MFSYFIGCKAGPGGENPFLDSLDTCRGHQNECGGMQIFHVFVFSGDLVCIVAFRNFLCIFVVCVDEG